ncbi:MAG: hypothetical protein H0X25_23580 [Acidobacteriales bacterium]|nr:hypothetical protein [Terriglobales bacterium]
MISTIVDPKMEISVVETTGENGTNMLGSEGLTHRFQEGVGNHPLWQEYLAELESNCQADLALEK